MEQTLCIIKPDAVKRGLIGKILGLLEDEGFRFNAIKLKTFQTEEAKTFYKEHKDLDFYEPLIEFMTSGPCILAVLESENAVENYRKIIGNTDFQKAEKGTVRALFATSVKENCVHGSDSIEAAKKEINFFFIASEINQYS